MTTPALAQRPAVRFLNYPGDVTSSFSPHRPLGPSTMGEALWPVGATYDAEQDRTRVGFSFIAPAPKCRVCGCTDDQACVGVTGPCSWVAPDLCSSCVVGRS